MPRVGESACSDYRLLCCVRQLNVGSPAKGKYNRRVYFAYSVLLSVALVLSAPWWLLQMVRHGKYRAGLRERLGFIPERKRDTANLETVWIHAVSVGEVLAVTHLVEELKTRLRGWRIVVSTTTDTGQRLARQRFGEKDVFYLPLDLAFAVRPYLRALRPKLLVLAESEFWPNLLHEAKTFGAAVAVVNARVSDRSLPRYLRYRGLLRRVMQNVDAFLAQSDEDARRLVAMGAPAERVQLGGNLKFEVKLPARSPIVDRFANALHHGQLTPIIVAGSTLQGEEEMLLASFLAVLASFPASLMVLAPRHPERFMAVASLLDTSGLPWQRRSQWDGQSLPVGGVLLLDTIGELAALYQFADVAFVGGSLVPKGGHNVLEVAQYGVPILVGPYTENFRDIVGILLQADALTVVTPETLTPTMLTLLADEGTRKNRGGNAQGMMQSQQGATERTLEALLALAGMAHPAHIPETRP